MNRSSSGPSPPASDGRVGTRTQIDLSVTSQVDARWHGVLERMLFFNDQQFAVRARVVAVIERYGALQIDRHGDGLRLRLEQLADTQSLFAVLGDGRPVGCVVYSRDAADRFLVLHVAIEPAFTIRGGLADADVLLKLVGAVRAAARLTRGVQRVDLLYAAGRMRSLRVRSSVAPEPG